LKKLWGVGLGIVVVALAVRWTWAAQPRIIRWDEAFYMALADHWISGQGFQTFGVPELTWPPIPPALAAASLAAGAAADQALALWHVLVGALACGLLFGLSYDITRNRFVAAATGLLAAVSPALSVWPLYWGSLTESVFIALLLAGLWGVWRMLNRGGWLAALTAGLAFGAAYLTRPEAIGWWGLFGLLGLGMAVWRKRGWRNLAIYALTFVLVAAPYVAYLYHHTGRFLLSGKGGISLILSEYVVEMGGAGQDYYAQLDSTGQEILWLSPEQFDASLIDLWLADPIEMLSRLRDNITRALDALLGPILGPWIIVLIALGLFGRVWDRRRLLGEAFWWLAVLPFASLLLLKIETRYLGPLAPFALLWAAWGIQHLGRWASNMADRWLRGRVWPHAWPALILALVIVGSLSQQPRIALREQATMTPSYKAAGEWLAAHSRADEPVMSRNPEVGYYAHRPLVAFPKADWADVVAYGRRHAAAYLVTNSWEIERLRPQLSFLLDPAQAPPELEFLAQFEDPNRTTLVYRWRF